MTPLPISLKNKWFMGFILVRVDFRAAEGYWDPPFEIQTHPTLYALRFRFRLFGATHVPMMSESSRSCRPFTHLA